jgi:hypothetical protein
MATNKSRDYQIQIYRGLELLARGLRPWCETKMEVKHGRNWSNVVKNKLNLSDKYIDDISGKPKLYDPYVLLLILILFWSTEEKSLLSSSNELAIAKNLLEIRNSWAHFERIDDNVSTNAWTLEETERILTDIRALLEKVCATEYVKEIDELVRHLSYKYIDWQDVCSQVLNRQISRVLKNKLLGRSFSHPSLLIPSKISEIKDLEVYSNDSSHEKNDKYKSRSKPVSVDIFCESLSNHNYLAVIGDGGSGKTTFLYQVALQIISKNLGLPIFISLADLRIIKGDRDALEKHLHERWLKEALPFIKPSTVEVTPELKSALWTQFDQAQVWLLLDAADEMDVQDGDRLNSIQDQLYGWLSRAKVLLSCRPNVWNSSPGVSQRFTTYKIEKFNYGTHEDYDVDQVGQFIENWFGDLPKEGVKLRALLNTVENQRIRDLVRNPLRLSLLCNSWERPAQLPETQASLYSGFVESFYKSSRVRISKQKVINKILGTLAQWALNQENSRFRIQLSQLPKDLLEQLGDEDDEDSVLSIALKIGFLNNIGFTLEDPSQFVYTFCHANFQEYFASLAIDDASYFFPKEHFEVRQPVHDNPYRIFDSKWREVILFWIGQDRSKLSNKEKTSFIDSLRKFYFDNTNILNHGNFYGLQALFLAASCLSEFKDYKLCADVLELLVKEFCDLDKEGSFVETSRFSSKIAKELLQEIGIKVSKENREKAVEKISSLYYQIDVDDVIYELIETLIILIPEKFEINELMSWLMGIRSEEVSLGYVAKNALIKIGLQDSKTTEIFIKFLLGAYESHIKKWSEIRRTGVNINRTRNTFSFPSELFVTQEEVEVYAFVYGCIVDDLSEMLSIVSPGNSHATKILVDLLKEQWEDCGYSAFVSLQKINPKNINARDFILNELINGEDKSRWRAVHCLLISSYRDSKITEEVKKYLMSKLKDENQAPSVRKDAARAILEFDSSNSEAIQLLFNELETNLLHQYEYNGLGEYDCLYSLKRAAAKDFLLSQKVVDLVFLLDERLSWGEKLLRGGALPLIEELSRLCPSSPIIRELTLKFLSRMKQGGLSKTGLKTLEDIACNVMQYPKEAEEFARDLLNFINEAMEHLTQKSDSLRHCSYAIRMLGVFSKENLEVGDYLLSLLDSENKALKVSLIESLGNLVENQSVISLLESYLAAEEAPNILLTIAETLTKISPGHLDAHSTLAILLLKDVESSPQFPSISIKKLRELLAQPGISRFVNVLAEKPDISLKHQKCLDILWFCSQNITYYEFYQAWYGCLNSPVGSTAESLQLERIYNTSSDNLSL